MRSGSKHACRPHELASRRRRSGKEKKRRIPGISGFIPTLVTGRMLIIIPEGCRRLQPVGVVWRFLRFSGRPVLVLQIRDPRCCVTPPAESRTETSSAARSKDLRDRAWTRSRDPDQFPPCRSPAKATKVLTRPSQWRSRGMNGWPAENASAMSSACLCR